MTVNTHRYLPAISCSRVIGVIHSGRDTGRGCGEGGGAFLGRSCLTCGGRGRPAQMRLIVCQRALMADGETPSAAANSSLACTRSGERRGCA
jgi:hypothetical protein